MLKQRVNPSYRRRFATTAAAAALFMLAAGAPHAQTAPALAPATAAKPGSAGTVYEVGYTHLDTQWCWTMPQVIDEFLGNTLHDNFALFDKYPDYVFNWTGSNRYKLMKEYYPAQYARLKRYAAQGRWYPNGSAVEEGDIDSPSSESIIRNVLYANEFFRDEFGRAPDDFMLPDCFGFPASLPTILAHCGIKGFSTQKLTWSSAVGIPFNVGVWVGPDGHGVVSALNPGSYGSQITDDLSSDPDTIQRLNQDAASAGGVRVDYKYYGTGDRGGAPDENSVKLLEQSLHAAGPVHVVSSRADQMFQDLTLAQIAALPRYEGDLLLTGHSTGSLTSEAAMKRWNRKNELLADDAERAGVAADWLGAQPYDKARLTDAWLRFLPGQFHDLMAGTAIPQAYDYTWNDEIIALNEFSGVLTESVGAVARGMDTRARGVSVLLYNPLSIPRQDVAEATLTFPDGAPKAVCVFGSGGKEVASQIADRNGNSLKVLFLATVPSVGFASYDVRPAAGEIPQSSPLKISTHMLENARYRVALDSVGDVASIYDKSAQRELLAHPARLAYQHEDPVQWPAWNMDWDDQKKPPASYVDGPADVKIVERGPVRVALQVTRHHLGSTFVQTIRLAAGGAGNRVEFATVIDWQGRETALKATFPLNVSNEYATYNWGIGTVRRSTNNPKKFEVPSHEWFDLTDNSGKYGVSVLDDCKYGSDKPDGSTLRLTLLYSPGTRAGFQHQGSQDWGHNEMLYALSGHAGDWRVGKSQWEAARLNQPLLAFQTPSHPGALGESFSLASVSNPNLQIEALKQAERGKRIIVRLNELAGASERNVRIRFAAPIIAATEVNGQEMTIGPATVNGGDLIVNTTAYHPKAYALTLAAPRLSIPAPTSEPLTLPYNASVADNRPTIEPVWSPKTEADADNAPVYADYKTPERIAPGSPSFSSVAAIPGDMLPPRIESNGIMFRLASASSPRDAIACAGQTIALPPGKSRRIYLLAASSSGDTPATFLLGGFPAPLTIQSWNGFVGQWDKRVWGGRVPELTYDWPYPLTGFVPGYIKRAPIAWYADHTRLADGTNNPYAFCYLFRYALDVPDGAATLRLPNNPAVKILAATLARNGNDDTTPAEPLYDTLNYRASAAPAIAPAAGTFHDATEVTISPPLYFKGALHYTTDGTRPTITSRVYSGPLTLTRTTVVRAVYFTGAVPTTPFAASRFVIHDTTPPRLLAALGIAAGYTVIVKFNEPMASLSCRNPIHYFIDGTAAAAATLAPDQRTVTLTTATPLAGAEGQTITVSGVRDLAGNPTAVSASVHSLTISKPVYEAAETKTFTGAPGSGFSAPAPNLPVKADVPWTINLFVELDRQPDELTAIAGFGDGHDTGGDQRFLIKYQSCIYFWGSGVDIPSNVPFDLGKWQMVTITYDGGNVSIYKNGQLLRSAPAGFSDAQSIVTMAPDSPWGNSTKFSGKISGFTLWNRALADAEIPTLMKAMPQS